KAGSEADPAPRNIVRRRPLRSRAACATSPAAASSSPGVGEDSLRCVPSRAAGDSAPGMCARPAEVEAANPGKAVACVAEERPPSEDLIEGVLAVHRVPAAEAVLSLEVFRRHDVASDDALRDAWCVDLERPHSNVRHPIACC